MDYRIKFPCGIDISMWERTIDWTRLSPTPSLVIAKASEYKWTDPAFEEHWQNMSTFGAPRGCYHFFRADDVAAQVQTYLDQCRKVGALVDGMWTAEIPPILDAEYAPPKPPRKKPRNYKSPPNGAALAGQYKVWLDMVEQATGVKPIIYTSSNYWNYTLDWFGKPPSWTREYMLWLAYYPDYKDSFSAPTGGMMPKGWELEDVVMWQYAEDGRLTGIPYDGVDLNWIDDGWLATLLGVDGENPPQETVDVTVNMPDGGKNLRQERYFMEARSVEIVTSAGETVRLP